MKKIFTILLSCGLVTVASAQDQQRGGYGNNDKGYGNNDKGYAYNDRNKHDDRNRFDDRFSYTLRDRDMDIARVNREFDFRINAIERNYRLSRGQRMKQIRSLEKERDFQLRLINDKFYDKRNRYYTQNGRW